MTVAPSWLVRETMEIMGIRRTLHGHAGDPDFARMAVQAPPADVLIREVVAQKPGFVFLDCGACMGFGALIASAAGAHIVAIDADPRAALCLRSTFAQNGLPVAVIEAGLGAGGPDLWFRTEARLGAGRVSAEGALQVRQATIDSVVRDLDLHAVDLVSLDLNGFEFEALRGGADVLSRFKPLVLMRFDPMALTISGRSSPATVIEWILERFGAVDVVEGDARRIERGASIEDFVRESFLQPPVWLRLAA